MDSNQRSDTAAFTRRRPLFWLALFFGAGIAADRFLEPGLPSLGGFCLAALAGSLLVLLLRRGQLSTYANFACAATAAFAAGLLLHGFGARVPPADDVSRRTAAAPSFVWLEGTITEAAPDRHAECFQWTLSVAALGSDEYALTTATGLVRLSAPSTVIDFGAGDRVRLRARLEMPPEITLPERFDYRAYLERQGIRRSGAAFGETIARTAGPAWWRPDLLLRRWGSALARRLETVLPSAWDESGNRAALLNALLFGTRERLDVSDREAFAISGTAHLLAISGLQIHFLAWLLFRLAACARLTRRRAAWLVMLCSCAYCVLAGADPPILRATIMIVLYLGAVACWREPDPLSILGASAFVVLVFSPAELFNAGFQLSFLAVLSLLTVLPALEGAWDAWRGRTPELYSETRPWRARAAQYARMVVFVSLAAWLGTAPCVAWHMGRFSTLSLLSNIVAVPLSSMCMVLGLAALAASLLSAAAATAVGWLALLFVAALQGVNALIAAVPFAALDLPPPPLAVLIAYAAALFWLWLSSSPLPHSKWKTRKRAFRALRPGHAVALVVAPLFLLNAGILFRENAAASTVTLLDLKAGRAALVEAPGGGAALIDAGGLGQGTRIADVLRRRGVSRLALLVITADESEAIAGAVELLKRVPAARVLLPRAGSASAYRRELERFLTARAVPYAWPDPSQPLRGPGEARWEFWDDGPRAESPATSQAALAVRLTLPGRRLLLVNARSGAALQRLLAKTAGAAWDADILYVTPGESARWPAETAQVIRRCGCHVLIAGADPSELPGLDLAALAEAQNLRLFSPRQDGSVRIQADAGPNAGTGVELFRNGAWERAR